MALRRYTPLQRKKPLQRKAYIVSSRSNPMVTSEETKKPIRKVSEKRLRESKIYSNIREIFLRLFIQCGAGLPGCTVRATEIHHMLGRGKYYLIIRFFLGVCRNCHDRITVNSREAIQNQHSFSRSNTRVHYLQNFDKKTVLVLIQKKHNLLIIN